MLAIDHHTFNDGQIECKLNYMNIPSLMQTKLKQFIMETSGIQSHFILKRGQHITVSVCGKSIDVENAELHNTKWPFHHALVSKAYQRISGFALQSIS